MTQPTEAVGGEPIAPQPTPEERLNAAFGDELVEQQDEELPAEGAEESPPEEAEDDTELEAEIDELPPIEAPVSWDAEAKERFAKLPREDQEYLAKRESERERFVQQKSQEAARAKQEVERAAYEQLSQYNQSVAQQLQQLAAQIGPQRPDPAMIQYDPAAFYAQQAKYEQSIAQQHELQQRAQEYASEAQEQQRAAEQAHHAEQHSKIVEHFPEYLDPTTGPKLQQELSAVARDLGYPPELIAQARADDILAMKQANEWRQDSMKYRALQARKMEKVREAKKLPPVAKPGVAQAPGAQRSAQIASDRDAMKRGDRDATVRVLDAFFDPKSR